MPRPWHLPRRRCRSCRPGSSSTGCSFRSSPRARSSPHRGRPRPGPPSSAASPRRAPGAGSSTSASVITSAFPARAPPPCRPRGTTPWRRSGSSLPRPATSASSRTSTCCPTGTRSSPRSPSPRSMRSRAGGSSSAWGPGISRASSQRSASPSPGAAGASTRRSISSPRRSRTSSPTTTGPPGRCTTSASALGPCSDPGRRSGSAVRPGPPSGARPSAATAGCRRGRRAPSSPRRSPTCAPTAPVCGAKRQSRSARSASSATWERHASTSHRTRARAGARQWRRASGSSVRSASATAGSASGSARATSWWSRSRRSPPRSHRIWATEGEPRHRHGCTVASIFCWHSGVAAGSRFAPSGGTDVASCERMARFVELRRPGPDRPAAAGAVDGPTLAALLHEIGAAAAEPVDALEPALHAILEATGAAAGAVCLFDARREVLRLAAEEGLSDEGCHQLRTVRRGDIASWDMPLHGLMNRRAYLIESAAQNRYVPPLVEAGAAIRTVACLPVYAGSVPVGSLVPITRTPRAFTERDLGGLQQPLREMAQLIEAVRRQASERAAAGTPSLTAVPSPTPPTAARSEAPSAPESTPADAGHDGSLAAALAAAQRENARLAMELERLRAEAPRDAVRFTEQTAEIDHLRAQLAEAEAGAAHEQRAREEIEAALARGSSGGHAELQLALDTARRAETARAALAAEHARLTAELERLQAGATHEELAGEHAAEVDRLRARLAEAEAGAAHEHRAREQLEAALERGASVGQLELRQALEAARQAEAARATLAAEKARLGDELERWRAEAVRAEPLKEALAHAETEHARLAAALEAATAERAEENRTEAARAQAKAAEHEAEMERVLARLAEAEATAAREERTRRALDAASEHEGSAQSNDVRQALEAARTAEEARDAAAIALAAARADLTRTLAQLEALREDAAGAHRELERLAAHE